MDTQHLRTFVEVATQGSFAAAARRMGLATSQVTRAVAALEKELGVRLMHRSTRCLTLTDAGATYFERVSVLLGELDAAGDELRTGNAEVRGAVRITASLALGQRLVLPLMSRLHTLYPALELDLRFSDMVVDLIGQQVDVALRQSATVDESMVGVRLGGLRYRVCASPAYLERHGRPRVPSDLADCDCLRIGLPGFQAEWSFRPLAAPDAPVESVRVGGWLVASSALTLRDAALTGLGPVLMADWLLDDDIDAGRLVDLFPGFEATSTSFDHSVWLLYASRAHLPRRVRVVIDFLRTELQAVLARNDAPAPAAARPPLGRERRQVG
ncbi:LysR family transcriptional regulator [Xylophilus sp. Kf1]|nr:LysR family transcriptional regulator [Xylophilus sp. Kf1]